MRARMRERLANGRLLPPGCLCAAYSLQSCEARASRQSAGYQERCQVTDASVACPAGRGWK